MPHITVGKENSGNIDLYYEGSSEEFVGQFSEKYY